MPSCIDTSLRSQNAEEDQPLTVIAFAERPVLRTWRLTPSGLVEITDENRAQMGAFLDKPKTAKTNCSGEGNERNSNDYVYEHCYSSIVGMSRAQRFLSTMASVQSCLEPQIEFLCQANPTLNQGLRYAMASMQGWRVDMEDAHVVEVSMADHEPYKDWSFFAVFDGHAGNVAADDAAENIMKTLMETPQFGKVTEELKANGGALCEKSIALLEDGIKAGFLSLDENIRARLDSDRSGSTAVCAMITPTHIIIANLGDSRAVVSRKNEGSFGTEDHKPYHDKERERIVGAGGSVMIQRINGSLAVSRAFGDFEYKNVPGLEPNKQLVSPEPDVYVLERQKEKDEFLVVACDGIYDVMENEELCRFVESRLHVCDDLNQVCNDVLDACLSKGSRDNMTMIVICFDAAPTIDKEMVASEAAWKAQMVLAINDVIKNETSKSAWSGDDEISTEFVLRELAQRVASNTGGPVHMLRSLVDQVLTEKGIKHEA